MRAASQAGLKAAADRWEGVLTERGRNGVQYAEQLFHLVDTMDEVPGLRRALTDPARDGQEKAALVRTVFGGKLSEDIVDLLAGMVRGRWSAEADLAEALSSLAFTSALACAQANDRLLAVETEVFELGRLLNSERELRMALIDRELPPENRVKLVDRLFAERIEPETLVLLRRVAATLRCRTVPSALAEIGERAAARRKRLVATITAAIPLTTQQVERISRILESHTNQPIHINLDVDPAVMGGFRIQFGTKIIDATIQARLEEAGRAIIC